jgi:hypothetical protein
MERIENLAQIVQREVADYQRPALKATTYYFEDRVNHHYLVILLPDYEVHEKVNSGIVVMARIVGDTIIIDEDTTDRPLFEELVRAGIPREKIVLLYAGEQPPQPESAP